MRLTSILGVIAGSLGASAVMAAPATPDQAQFIKMSLERYVGHGEAGGQSPVTVTPEGDHYTIVIDLKTALRGLESMGLKLDAASYTMAAAPQDGDTWHITSAGVPRMTIHHGGDAYSVVMNGTSFDGVFDTRLPGFASSITSYDSMSIAAVDAKGGTQTREIRNGKQTSTMTAAGEGLANVQITQSNDGFSQDVTLDVAPQGDALAANKVSVKSGATSGSIAIDALHNRALADLWAFSVAHPNKEALKAAEPELRGALRQALPLFDRWTQAGSIGPISVESPIGTVTVKSVGGKLSVTGLVAKGQIDSELRVGGLSIPTELLPSWSDGLVPVSAEIQQSFSGFHLDRAAQQAVDSFDLNGKEPFSAAVLASMRESLGSLDEMTLVMAPSHLVSKLLDIHIEGDVRWHQLGPDIHLSVRAAGLDKAIQDIQSRSGGDPTAAQLIGGLALAKGLGKAEPDGSLSWTIATGAGGAVTINGLALPGVSIP